MHAAGEDRRVATQDAASRIARALAELDELADMPLRLSDVASRMVRTGELEDEVFAVEEACRGTDAFPRGLRDDFVAAVAAHRRALERAALDPGVSAEAMAALECRWRVRHPDGEPSSGVALAVLVRHPDDALLSVAATGTAVRPLARPGRVPRASHRAPLLLACPQWYLDLLAAVPGPHHLGGVVLGADEDERHAVASLWDAEPCGDFHDPARVLTAVRLLG